MEVRKQNDSQSQKVTSYRTCSNCHSTLLGSMKIWQVNFCFTDSGEKKDVKCKGHGFFSAFKSSLLYPCMFAGSELQCINSESSLYKAVNMKLCCIWDHWIWRYQIWDICCEELHIGSGSRKRERRVSSCRNRAIYILWKLSSTCLRQNDWIWYFPCLF